MSPQSAQQAPEVGPSNDPDRPITVRLGADVAVNLPRDDAWRLWHQLQAELVRTLPYPPSYPAARITS